MPQAQVLPFPLTGAASHSAGSQPQAPPRVPRVPWSSHFAYLDQTVEPGQHISVISPTDKGKSTLIIEGLMPLWTAANALLFDLKGDDDALLKFGHRVTRFPNRAERWSHEHRHRKRPPWYRFYVPGILDRIPIAQQHATVRRALIDLSRDSRRIRKHRVKTDDGHSIRPAAWVVIADEAMALVDLKLDAYLRDLWQRGRSRGITFIAASQEPRWIPRAMYSQPQHIYIGRINDEDDQKRLAEIAGDRKLITGVVKGLAKHEFLYIGQGGDRMEIVNVRK